MPRAYKQCSLYAKWWHVVAKHPRAAPVIDHALANNIVWRRSNTTFVYTVVCTGLCTEEKTNGVAQGRVS